MVRYTNLAKRNIVIQLLVTNVLHNIVLSRDYIVIGTTSKNFTGKGLKT